MGNLPGVLAVGNVLVRPALVLPHVTVRDIRQLDWRRLHAAGIRGLVFDKDNCLTAPHVDSLAPEIEEAWAEARKVFGPQNILIVSNSAGTTSDPLGVNAEHLSRKLGVPVLCHDAKKPSRACARDVLNYFASVAPGSAQGQLLDAAPKEAGPSTPGPSTRIIVPARPRASLFHPFGRTSQANVHQDQAILVVGDRTMTDVILAHRLDDSLRARHRSASRRSRSALLSPPKATRSETTVGVAAALSGVVRGPGEAEHNSGPPRCISVLTTGLWAHEGRVNDLLRAGEARMTGALRRRGFMPGQRGWRPALRVPERPVVTDGRSAHQADAHADWQALAVRPVPATSSALGPDAAQFAYTHATVPSPVSASENEGAALFLALVLRPLPPAVSRIVLSVARSVPFRSLGLLMSKFGSLFNEGLEQGLNSARSKTMGAVGLRGPFSGRRPRVGPSDVSTGYRAFSTSSRRPVRSSSTSMGALGVGVGVGAVDGSASAESGIPPSASSSSAKPAVASSSSTAAAPPRPIIKRKFLIAGLGNHTHPYTRHSIGQILVLDLPKRMAAHDTAVRAQLAREYRVQRRAQAGDQSTTDSESEVGKPSLTSVPARFKHSTFCKGFVACMTVLLDSTPPKGRATPKDKGPTASQPGKVYPLIEAKVIFFKSRFPMNTSGKTIKAAHRSFSVPKPNIIILHDDLSRPFPRISHKFSGSANGHNGVRSLTVSLNTEEFHRIRVGIGRPVDGEEVADYVLGRLGEEEVKACQWPEKWGTELPGRFVRGNGGGVTALEKGKVEQGAVLDAVWREIERLMVADEVQ